MVEDARPALDADRVPARQQEPHPVVADQRVLGPGGDVDAQPVRGRGVGDRAADVGLELGVPAEPRRQVLGAVADVERALAPVGGGAALDRGNRLGIEVAGQDV